MSSIFLAILISIFTIAPAYAQVSGNDDLCGFNSSPADPDTLMRIEKVCFAKIENLNIWQAHVYLNNGNVERYFMRDPAYDQSASILTNKAVLKALLYAETGFIVMVGEIYFFYPFDSTIPAYAEGTIPSGLRFNLPNMGAPGLKTPNRD